MRLRPPASSRVRGKQGGRHGVHTGREPAGLHGLRRVRGCVPHRLAGHGAHRRTSCDQQAVFDYCVARGCPQARAGRQHRQGQPVQAARCWSSPAPAPAAPKPPMPAWSPSCSATACTLPTPPAAPPSGAARLPPPPTAPTSDGHGPAWSNSLFEDNAEHGLGMLLGYEAVQDMVVAGRLQGALPATRPLTSCKASRPELAGRPRWTPRPARPLPPPSSPSWSKVPRAREVSPAASWRTRATSPRRACGSSAATAGPTTSATAGLTT